MKTDNQTLAKSVRWYRKWHRYIAIPALLFVAIMSITGLLLAWKDQLQLKPPSATSTSKNEILLPIADIENIAIKHIDSLGLSIEINRLDYRPKKGIAKITFENHFTELQIDCFSGKILSQKIRTADIIEMIHDGSIVDYLINSDGSFSKLFYSSTIALVLLFLSFSGFWLWKKPKQIKKSKKTI